MKLGIFFGGQSTEREVSFNTCYNICKVLSGEIDIELFELDLEGKIWMINRTFFNKSNWNYKDIGMYRMSCAVEYNVDIFMSLIHGNLGEDGGLQGLFRSLNKPFVGCSTLASALCMDKDITKRILDYEGINVADWLVMKTKESYTYEEIIETLGCPFYVKPASLGSSVGISRVTTKKEFVEALDVAFTFDKKIVLEQEIRGIEIECGVIGNEKVIVSEVGSIETEEDGFYDYTKKYVDEHGAILSIPALISKNLKKEIQDLSKKIYGILECQGMARIDFFIDQNEMITVSEVNTVPGFTNSSMFPLLFKEIGISYKELLLSLISYGFEMHENNNKVKYEL